MRLALAVAVLAAGLGMGAAWGEGALDWMETAYSDGRHNAFTDLVRWKDNYYLCFRHGASHSSMDGEIRVMRSPDMRAWTPCGTLDTYGDDRDPHFAVAGDTLYVYFGVWDLDHREGAALPERGRVRSYFATTTDGETWSKIRGVYEPGWWLWRVSHRDGVFYSAAYTAERPKPDVRETRLLRSDNGLDWTLVSVATRERLAGEADLLFPPDGSIRMLTRTGDPAGDAMWLTSNPERTEWQRKDTGVMVHAPVFAYWGERLFVAGRARGEKGSVTRLWEVKGDDLVEQLTLPSGGDTSYPGLISDPAASPDGPPALFISWYSQHENEGKSDAAAIYVARVTVTP